MADGEGRDVQIDVIRDIRRKDLDVEIVEDLVQHAAKVADTVRNADQADRNRDSDLLVRLHLVQVQVENVHRTERITLNLADESLHRGPAVHRYIHDRG